MSEIKQVWGIIKDYQCADLEMVQGPALAVWNARQAEIDELRKLIKDQINVLKAASGSWVYTEREKNIMLSQADDLEKILRGEHETE